MRGREVAQTGAGLLGMATLIEGDSLAGAIVTTVAYSDIFAFAPTVAEIQRFLIGWRADRRTVGEALRTNPELRRILGVRDDLWFFRGKDHLALRRTRFSKHSEYMWPRARQMADKVAGTGLASCGMVTGSLASNNADEHADIDFLFIYPRARTYLSFAAIRLLVHDPATGLAELCPNYCLPDDRLEIRPQNLFTAWEIAKAVPMFGFDMYARFAHANRWVRDYLPNALPILDAAAPASSVAATSVGRFADRLADFPLVRRFEDLERKRKQGTDRRDVGVDMDERAKQGSVDRHSPTRSFHTLSELRYRMDQHGLQAHPIYEEIDQATRVLGDEMTKWGAERIKVCDPSEAPDPNPVNGAA